MKRLWFLILVLLSGCTNHSENKETKYLQDTLQKLEKESTQVDEQIKSSSNDREQQLQIISEKELLKSRIERLKAQLGMSGGKTE